MAQNAERSARMSSDELAQLHAALEQAPDIPRPEPTDYSMNQVIQVVYSALVTMKQRGYRIEDICEFIEHRSGYAIKPNTLAKYMSQERQRRRRQRKRRGSTRAPAQSSQTQPKATVPPAQIEVETAVPAVQVEPQTQLPEPSIPEKTPPEAAAPPSSASQAFFQQLSKNAETFHRPRNPNARSPEVSTSEPSTDIS